MIPYGRHDISQADIDAVTSVLRSDFLTQGPIVQRFEAAVADWTGAAHGVAANSATSALHLACMALGLGPGDRLWTSPITFVASANCGLYCGAMVDFVDIDPATYNMSPVKLEEKLIAAEKSNTLPKVIVPVHMSGQSCDMEAIGALARAYGVAVIEDASHAIGGRWQNAPVGNCAQSDITVFSFHPVKIITTAEGGLATTNNPELAARMERMRSHGITRDPTLMTHEPDGPWYYQQIDLGLNYRMTEMQAALGLSQMNRLEQFVADRHTLAERYDSALADLPMTTPWRHPSTYSAFHLYIVTLDDPTRHRATFEVLRANGIGVNLHYIPVHLQPYYSNLGFTSGDFSTSEDYYSRAISIPLFSSMTEAQQDEVIAVLKSALK